MSDDLEELNKLSFSELKLVLESVEKAIKAEQIFLGEVKDAFIQDGDLWVIHKLHLLKVKDLVDDKSKEPMFTEKKLDRVKRGVEDLIILNRRRNKIIEEIKRRELGNEYFERNTLSISENNVNIIERANEMSKTGKDSSTQAFKTMFDELVESHFKSDILIAQLEKLEQDKDDEYLEYCVKRFKRRTITEWIKYYERIDKADQYERLKKENLPPELDDKNKTRITNAIFEESTLGQYTLENLELFENKYINKDYPGFIKTKIKNIRERIIETVKKIILIKRELKKDEQRLKDIEISFNTDVDDFPKDLKRDILNCKKDLSSKTEMIDKYRYELFGTFSKEGLIWKHDRLVRQFKKARIGDEELFQELDYQNTERYTQQLKDKILSILNENGSKVTEDEVDDLVLEVLKQHSTDEDDIFDEILYPEKAEDNLQKTINKVLQDNFDIKTTEERKPRLEEDIKSFNYNYAEVINSVKEHDPNKQIEHLNEVLQTSKKKEFDFELDRLKFEQAIISEISALQLKIDLSKEFKNGNFNVYNFEERHIIKYLKNIEEIKYKKNYLKYVLREIIKVKDNIEITLIDKESKNLRSSEYFDNIKRNALLYEKHQKEKLAESDDYYRINLQDERNKLSVLYENIDDEYRFLCGIDTENNEMEEKNISQRDKIKEILKVKFPDFKDRPIDIMTEIAKEIVEILYPELDVAKKKSKIASIRVEVTNMRNGKIPF